MNTVVLVANVIGGILLLWGFIGLNFFMLDDLIAKCPHRIKWLPGGWGVDDE